MEINKLQDIYRIVDTFNNESVEGQCAIGPDKGIALTLNIGSKKIYYNVYTAPDSSGINVNMEVFDADIIKYVTDLANIIINQ